MATKTNRNINKQSRHITKAYNNLERQIKTMQQPLATSQPPMPKWQITLQQLSKPSRYEWNTWHLQSVHPTTNHHPQDSWDRTGQYKCPLLKATQQAMVTCMQRHMCPTQATNPTNNSLPPIYNAAGEGIEDGIEAMDKTEDKHINSPTK
jgi:hypothetical protein